MIAEAKKSILRLKEGINKLSQKLHIRKYRMMKAGREVEMILHSGEDIKIRILGMMDHLMLDKNGESREEIDYSAREN